MFTDLVIFECPLCRTRVQVLGPKFIENLPSNLYIDSLLQLVGINTNGLPKTLETPPPSATNNTQNNEFFNPGTRCAHCKSICENFDITQCDHCKLVRGNMFISYTFFLIFLLFTDVHVFFRNSAAYVGHSIWKICGSN